MAKPLLKKMQMKTYEHLKQASRIDANVSVSTLRTDAGTQYRNSTDEATVEQYKLSMKDGSVFPPIDTVFDGQHHLVYDGFHRLAAISLLGKPTIAVRYIEGDVADAQLLALTVNAQHGLPRDLATKRKIGLAAICNPLLENCSNYELAKITGLSAPYIQGLRDPDTKLRQQHARDKAAAKRIKLVVTNPITSPEGEQIDTASIPPLGLDAGPDTNQISSELTIMGVDVGPSEEEIMASELAQQADMDLMNKLLESDDALATAHEEIKRLNHLNAQLEIRLHGIMNEKNAAIKMVKQAQKRCDRLEIEIKNYRRTKSEIRIQEEAHDRATIVKSIGYSQAVNNDYET